jgi:hypothetical protein
MLGSIHVIVLANGVLDENGVTHSQNGWVTTHVMAKYLHWIQTIQEVKFTLRKQTKMLLIMNIFAAHRHGELLTQAEKENIDLLFIPARMTGMLEPLDATIFDEQKSMDRSSWVEDCSADPLLILFRSSATVHLRQSINSPPNILVLEFPWKVFLNHGKSFNEMLQRFCQLQC